MPETRVSVTLTNGPPWGFRLTGGASAGLRVSRVRRRGPADVSGVREGDTVQSINGIPVSGLTYPQAMELAERGPVLSLEISRFKTFVTAMASVPQAQVEPMVLMDTSNSVVFQQANYQDFEDEVGYEDEEDSEGEHIMPADPEVRPIALEKLFHEEPVPIRDRESSPTKHDFADSAFYHDGINYYPTVAEQKEMAKKVAKTLFDTRNIGSKGNSMFERRRQRAEKWVTEGENSFDEVYVPPEPDTLDSVPTMDVVEKLKEPPAPPPPTLGWGTYIPPPPPLLPPPPPNAPKTVKEFMEKVNKTPKAEHRSVEPAKCFDIAAALHARGSKGSALFNKRRAKSAKWVLESEGTAGAEPPKQPLGPGMGILAQMAGGQGPANKLNLPKPVVYKGVPPAPPPPPPAPANNEPSSGRLFEKIQRLQDQGDAWEQALSTPAHSRTTSAITEDFRASGAAASPMMSPMSPMSPPSRADEVPVATYPGAAAGANEGAGNRNWRSVRFNRGDAAPVPLQGGLSEL